MGIACWRLRRDDMNVRSASADPRNDLAETAICNATNRLLQMMGHRSPDYAIEWESIPGSQPSYRLTLRSPEDTVTTDFTLDELRDKSVMQVGLAHLWGSVLKLLSGRQHEKVERQMEQLVSPHEETES
jgi:hypothetical protein